MSERRVAEIHSHLRTYTHTHLPYYGFGRERGVVGRIQKKGGDVL